MDTSHAKLAKILIVGGGPAALLTALVFSRQSLSLSSPAPSIRIIDKLKIPNGGCKGTGIQTRSIEMFNFLNGGEKGLLGGSNGKSTTLLEDVFDASIVPPPMGTWDEKAEKIIHVRQMAEAPGAEPGIPWPQSLSLPQPALERILRSHLARDHGIQVEQAVELIHLEQTLGDQKDGNAPGDKVIVTLKHSETGKEEKQEFDWVIGMDGGRGVTRKLLGISFLGETVEGERILTANAQIPTLDTSYWHRFQRERPSLSSGKPIRQGLMLKPLKPHPLFQVQLAVPEDLKSEDVPNDGEGIQKLFEEITGKKDLKLEQVEWISLWRANIRMVDRMRVGRVFLGGDAAHCHSPVGGQGTNTAVQDAFNLGWKLGLVTRHLAPPSLLDTYQAERLPVVAEMLNLSTALHAAAFRQDQEAKGEGNGAAEGVAETTTKPPQALDTTKPKQDIDPSFRPLYLRQLGINYRWSSIIVDDMKPVTAKASGEETEKVNPYFGTGERAGDRAADAPGLKKIGSNETAESSSLFEIFAKGHLKHTIIVFPTKGDINSLVTTLEPLNRFIESGAIQTIVIVSHENFLEPTSLPSNVRVLVDAEGHARRGYRIDESATKDGISFVVVRPDAFIGAIASSTRSLHEYFERVFGESGQ